MFNPFLLQKNELKKILYIATVVATSIGTTLIGNVAYAQDISTDAIVHLTNTSRSSIGAHDLIVNEQLNQAAYNKAQNMLADQYFDHNSPSGLSPWVFILNSGYDYSLAGENLAMDFVTAEGVNTAWLHSPSHARNILNPDFTDIGIAVVEGEIDQNPTTLVVQMFGKKTHSNSDALAKTIGYLLGLEGEANK